MVLDRYRESSPVFSKRDKIEEQHRVCQMVLLTCLKGMLNGVGCIGKERTWKRTNTKTLFCLGVVEGAENWRTKRVEMGTVLLKRTEKHNQ